MTNMIHRAQPALVFRAELVVPRLRCLYPRDAGSTRFKCERLGGNNYPVGRLQGELTMRVVIHHSGRLLEVTLLRSSGHPALDEAALRTVRQAAPYQPFNVDMRKRYDELSFTRTWQFSRRGAAIN